MSEVVIRRGAAGDEGGIARVHTLGWQQGHAGLLPADWLAARVVAPEVWATRIAQPLPRSALFVAEVDGELVGYAMVGPAGREAAGDGTDVVELYAIYVLAEHWGQGVGFALHTAALQAIRDLHYRRAQLWVLSGSARTIDFYVRQGWRDDGYEVEEDLGGVTAPVRRYSHHLELVAADP
jgi:GNAT superfamily N-acetyltransferase